MPPDQPPVARTYRTPTPASCAVARAASTASTTPRRKAAHISAEGDGLLRGDEVARPRGGVEQAVLVALARGANRTAKAQ